MRSQPQMLKRTSLVAQAMASADEDAMRLFAQAFENSRGGILACVYWEDLKESESGFRKASTDGDDDDGVPSPEQCTVM
jgi:hypothetical protein